MKLTVFSSPTCPYCKMLKEYLATKGVAYEDIDVSTDPAAVERLADISGQMGVPVAVFGEEVVIGFNKPKIDEIISKMQ